MSRYTAHELKKKTLLNYQDFLRTDMEKSCVNAYKSGQKALLIIKSTQFSTSKLLLNFFIERKINFDRNDFRNQDVKNPDILAF